jgi:ATP-dependent RNA helicase DeaD
VATDVAARGIDLPSLSLVVHVEIPRDAETLQHRSGRTGRAGKKGIAVIIVPFPRRRRVESMLHHAKINAEWINAPSREDIIAQDRVRLLDKLMQPVEVTDGDRELADKLLETKSPQEIAAMLVQAHRASMPEPEELLAQSVDAQRAAQKERHREGFEDTVWFRMDIGRRQNADPRWVMPLICRRGHITRNEIGAIRIGQQETYFQIPRAIAGKFAEAVAATAGSEENGGYVAIEHSNEPPRMAARENAKRGKPNGPAPQRPFKPKPVGPGAAPGAGFAKPKHFAKAGGKPQGKFKGKPKGRD